MDFFCKNLQYLSKDKNQNINSISKNTSIDINVLKNYLSGEKYPSIQDINILSAYFNVSVDEMRNFDHANMLGKTVDIDNVISFEDFNLDYNKITKNYKKNVRIFTTILMIPPLAQQIFVLIDFTYPHYLIKYIVILYIILFILFIYDVYSNVSINNELLSKNVSHKRVLINDSNEIYFRKVFQAMLYVLLGIIILIVISRYFSVFIYAGVALLIFSVGITSGFLISIDRETNKK